MITQAELKELLHYDPETGVFRWRVERANGSIKPWSVAGTISNGYSRIYICKKLLLAHRLAWLYMTGEWPDNDIDHEDRVRSNNAWRNLRPATRKQNMENQSVSKKNTSGFRGVSWDKKRQKWHAYTKHNKKRIHVGYFSNAEDAAKASDAKRTELYTHYTGM